MPCRDYSSDDEYRNKKEHEAREKIDKLTRMLCSVCTEFRMEAKQGKELREVREWWRKHQETDAERLAAEEKERKRRKAKKIAIRKLKSALTAEERQLLGIKVKEVYRA